MTDRLIDRLAVTGTDTGVGKTVVACALAARARQRGLRVAVMKPVESGIDVAPTDGTVRSDAERLRAAAGSTAPLDLVRPFVYDEPLAPMIAAARSGRPVVMAELDRCRAILEAETDLLLVEGAGGILVPLDVHTSYVDLFVRWQTGVVVVAGNRLGVLNHTLLTVRAIEAAGLHIRGVILSALTPPESPVATDPSRSTNFDALQQLLPHLPLFQFPWVEQVEDPDVLATTAAAAGFDQLLPRVVS